MADLGSYVLAYLLLIDVIALVSAVVAVSTSGFSPAGLWKAPLVLALALAFEEGASRAARLRFRFSSDLDIDMSSVWAIAVAVALTPGQAMLVVVPLLGYSWLRQQRPAGRTFYRIWFSGSSVILGCLAAGWVADAVRLPGLPAALAGALTMVLVIVTYTTVNRGLIAIAMVGSGAPVRAVLGTKDENLVELATLCLGGLVALALETQPWLAVLAIAPMVTLQRGALIRTLETAATIDAKTGMLNAVAWEHLAEKELARAERSGVPVAVLIIDIDRFKMVNDRFGHLAGDAVLRAVGKCLAAQVREYDTVARFGGEEFVAVLPAAGDPDALVIAERLRSRVSELRVSGILEPVEAAPPDDDDWLAVSIGVASAPTDGTELSDLLHAADGALYRAKAAGRNRVLLADRGTGPARDPLAQS
ncbi:MAG TPA: GGDEF domain-containing protein [Jatrophihabitans sp.]|nr:GGDEF domain-containing protein [Jatrophihabitans sp.]